MPRRIARVREKDDPPNSSTPAYASERDRLVLENRGIIGTVLSHLAPVVIDELGGYEDAFSVGQLGLITAAEKFDPSRGFKFCTFAYWVVRNYIFKTLQASMLLRINPFTRKKARVRGDHLPSVRASGLLLDDDAAYLMLEVRDDDTRAYERFDRDDIRKAVCGLNATDRKLLIEKYWRRMILPEMAAARGCTKQNVQTHVATARRRLAQLLTDMEDARGK